MSNPIKVLHLLSADGDWETSVSVTALAAALREHGVSSVIAAQEHSRTWELAEAGGTKAADIRLAKSLNPLRWLEIGRNISSLSPDVIHVHDAAAASAFARASLFSAARRLAVSRHNLDAPPARAEYRTGVGAIICPSEAVAGAFRDRKAPAEKIHVIPNGVSLSAAERAVHDRDILRTQFRDAYCPGKEKPLFLVTIAPLVPESRLEALLEAMTGVAGALPQTHLFVMGEGELLEELRRRTRNMALDDNVTVLEPDKAFNRMLAAADLYVSCRANDATGYMPKAAMATGLAVADAADSTDAAAGLERAILDLLENRTRREQAGRLARTRAAREFDVTRQAGKVAEVYRGLGSV